MRPTSGQKRFKLETKYPHLRSDGMTARNNGGTRALDDLAAAMDVAPVETPAGHNHYASWMCPCLLAMQQDPECPWHGRKEDDGDHRDDPTD